jgi:hypothetical protein
VLVISDDGEGCCVRADLDSGLGRRYPSWVCPAPGQPLWHDFVVFGKSGAVIACVLALCAVNALWLIVTVGTGGGLGGPVGALAGWVIVGVFLAFAARSRGGRESWLWRHATAASDEFVLARGAVDVVSAVTGIAGRHRGWQVTGTDPAAGSATVSTGVTLFSWRKRITVHTGPADGGIRVRVRSASPQLYDWGENRRVVAEIRHHLETSA